MTLAEQFSERQTYPAVIVVESKDGLSTQDRDAVAAFTGSIPALAIPVKGGAPVAVADYLTDQQVPVVPSEDERAALALVNFDVDKVDTQLADGENPIARAVEVIR